MVRLVKFRAPTVLRLVRAANQRAAVEEPVAEQHHLHWQQPGGGDSGKGGVLQSQSNVHTRHSSSVCVQLAAMENKLDTSECHPLNI